MENISLHFLLFALIGIVGMAWDFGTTWLLRDKMHWNSYLATGIGFALGVSNNYLLNMLYNYTAHNNLNTRTFSLFFATNMVGLLIDLTVIYVASKRMKIPFYASKIIAGAFGTIWTFTINHFWIVAS